MSRRRAAPGWLALIVLATPLPAQQLSLRAGGLQARYADSLDAGAGSLSAQVAWSAARSQGVLEASWAQFDTGSGAGQLWGNWLVMGPSSRRAGIGLRADGVSNAASGGGWSAVGSAELFAAVSSGRVTASAGVSAGGVRAIDTGRFATAGASARATLLAGTMSFSASATGTTSRGIRFLDAQLSADWRRGRLAAGALAGGRRGDLTGRPWYQGYATVRLTPALSLESALGSYPRDLAGYDRGRYANAGVRLRLGSARAAMPAAARAWDAPDPGMRVQAQDSGRVRLSFRSLDAAAPAIVGSWNDWSPQPLERGSDGRWGLVLALSPGTWRFAVVGDGGTWLVPEGVTRLPDDFGGEVGIFVITR